ncbi:GNAT family N-acetyltransferase [Zavarzinia sp.]|uniref:GNAT family N-acetyltransferase n=1 Tax=Zavarzinia sp. TaxID=2027920 RepID=UPI0035628C99
MSAETIFPAGPEEMEALAAIHGAAFPDAPLDAGELARLAAMPGAIVLAAAAGFILLSRAADETEVVTLAVLPAARRAGLGRRLLEAGLAAAAAAGAATAFLEVAIDNEAALSLYRRSGFSEVGRRRRYYRRADGSAIDALIMSRPLLHT